MISYRICCIRRRIEFGVLRFGLLRFGGSGQPKLILSFYIFLIQDLLNTGLTVIINLGLCYITPFVIADLRFVTPDLRLNGGLTLAVYCNILRTHTFLRVGACSTGKKLMMINF